MKNLVLSFAMLFSAFMFAQNTPEPVLEKDGNMVKATYFHENGEIAQQGYYLDGKLHGVWKSFDNKGNRTAIANYNKGEKVGKWFFWSAGKLNEVDYSDSRVASVTTYSAESTLVGIE